MDQYYCSICLDHTFAFALDSVSLTGAMGAVAHLCMISAFNRAEASLLAPFNYTKLLWVSVLGFLVFGDIPSFNMWVGATIIVAAGIYILYRERNT